jgi:dihydrolipoamide dehydrogenase
VVSTLTGGVSGLMKKNQIDVIEGEGSLAGPGKVTVGGDTIEAKTIILATGSVARALPGAVFGGHVIGTEGAWALDELPPRRRSSALVPPARRSPPPTPRLGVQVLLFEATSRVLPSEDPDISKLVLRGLKTDHGVGKSRSGGTRLRRSSRW